MRDAAKQLDDNKFHIGAHFSLHWVSNTLARHGMSMRAVQNTRKESVSVSLPKVLAYHQSLRKFISLAPMRSLVSIL